MNGLSIISKRETMTILGWNQPIYILMIMPPNFKKLEGHPALGLSVRPSVCEDVLPSVSKFK